MRFRWIPALIIASSVSTLSGCGAVIDRAVSEVIGEETYIITSESMEPTLAKGSRVTVSMVGEGEYEPKYGDVVLFEAPEWERDYSAISRVIGVPGSTVGCCDPAGRLLLNGKPLREDYVRPDEDPIFPDFSVTVPAGRLWLMGDHRAVALDSRSYQLKPGGGTISVSGVLGVIEDAGTG
ncbi:hypothetical protein Psi01_36570 [Planobispora siamensis]|uniref:Signal peptidase I n=2 Tax=Planobispora siamensis TaxID=936338 RepID=A0A8J3SHF5_9ACTN|nr:signal peptidase I [Planobispora siamensis]GIH93027.1 hypothetical protein Psi01_36570 [Planobispora siamensis]